ncbi:c-type cytochrome [Geobacter sp. DSM 9736]|uniref:c-type cytochrome n=1 Tax=Geobacter sp. DSM 9736 TaxID=1277350 RepID=UPI000B4FF67B|nr:c-type cytochrome [Geobacter sp. DSM 9736]SNB46935.1 cytochrome c6 [Geobacter sp. DSM 9736]
MKKPLFTPFCILAGFALSGAPALAAPDSKNDGKALFEQHCQACHAGGGNTMNPAKTLKKKELQANGIKTRDDIIKVVRNPGPGMTPFDQNTLSDQQAGAIADYVLKSFK